MTRSTGTSASTTPGRGVALRCNTRAIVPQRTPKAPDTEWGRPRRALGWSLRELAARTGINAGDLSKIERGISCATREQSRRINAAYDEAGVS